MKFSFPRKTASVAVALFTGCIIFASVFAQEPIPEHVTQTAIQITKRVESIEEIDRQLKPLKEEIGRLQDVRDLLDADLRDDAKSLQRWSYEYDWQTKSVRLRAEDASFEHSSSSSSEVPKA